jgi:hypothetical protein
MEILTVNYGDDEALPVFSHEEEAELFLGLGEIGDPWRGRESSAGEVVSLLFGPCVGVASVALDPSPFMAPEMIGLVRVGRDRFLDLITTPARKKTLPRSGWTQTPGRIGCCLRTLIAIQDRSHLPVLNWSPLRKERGIRRRPPTRSRSSDMAVASRRDRCEMIGNDQEPAKEGGE